MDLFILWLARSYSSLILLFTAFGVVYLLTNALVQTQTNAWDSWRRRDRVQAVAVRTGRSMVPLSLLLVVSFLGVGFIYGITGILFPQRVNQSHLRNVNFFYQAIVPRDDDDGD